MLMFLITRLTNEWRQKIRVELITQILHGFGRYGRTESIRSRIVSLFTVDMLLRGSFTRVMHSNTGSFSKSHNESFYVLPLVEKGGKSDT